MDHCKRTLGVALICAAIGSSGIAADDSPRDDAEYPKTTYVYKRVDDLSIRADVYRPADQTVRPTVVWIHGGALIVGHREWIDRRLKRMLLAAGYVVVSIDYRLAPETKLPEIIADLEDALRWVQHEGPRLFHADVRRVAVIGGSAGGYLTLTAGFRADPPPAALVAFFGYGDLIGDWYSQPSPHARHQRTKLTREEAWRQVDGPPISDARDRKGDGGAFYQFCRQTGGWPEAVSGWNPHKEPQKFFPYMPIKNVNERYPPTLLIHGTSDTDVPYNQSVMMARHLARHDVPHRLFTIPNGEHGLGGGDPKLIGEAYDTVMRFVERHVNSRQEID